jgi:hypothetical protein
MQYVILGALGLAILYGVGQLVVALDARTLVRIARYVVAALLILVGIGLSFARQLGLGLPAILFGFVLLFRGRLGSLDFGTGSRHAGQASSVRARFIEASLDHDSGSLSGQVREGRFAGRDLDDLSEAELQELRDEVRGDPDSAALLEAYLDRRFPGWRGDGEEDADTGAGTTADTGAMTDQQAYEILGLSPGASEAEIRAAHRRLLKGVHPDQGGSNFLAARINQAKDWLLGKHRNNP